MVRFLERCADTYRDQRGLVIPLVEEDFIFLLNETENPEEELLFERVRKNFFEIGINISVLKFL
jgi:hypothetical protein